MNIRMICQENLLFCSIQKMIWQSWLTLSLAHAFSLGP
jgi:hypothetical protein